MNRPAEHLGQGEALPVLTASYSGLVNEDTPASLTTVPTFTTTATAASAVGAYPITVRGAASSNYTITLVHGILTVTDRGLRVIGSQSMPGLFLDVPIALNATGNERAVGFSLNFVALIARHERAQTIPSFWETGGSALWIGCESGALVFGDRPIQRELSDTRAQSLPAEFVTEESDIEDSVANLAAGELYSSFAIRKNDQSGTFTLRLTGSVGSVFVLEESSDLMHWSSLRTVTLEQSRVDIAVPEPARTTMRFYRARRAF